MRVRQIMRRLRQQPAEYGAEEIQLSRVGGPLRPLKQTKYRFLTRHEVTEDLGQGTRRVGPHKVTHFVVNQLQ